MYADFLKELRNNVKSEVIQLTIPEIHDTNRIVQKIYIFGVSMDIITIVFDVKTRIFEVECHYKNEVTTKVSKDCKEIVEYITEELESDDLKNMINEVDLLVKRGEI